MCAIAEGYFKFSCMLRRPNIQQLWASKINSKLGPKSNQNRSKIGLKSDHEANANILKIISRGGVFEDTENRKAIKKQQKIVLKAILS